MDISRNLISSVSFGVLAATTCEWIEFYKNNNGILCAKRSRSIMKSQKIFVNDNNIKVYLQWDRERERDTFCIDNYD